MITIGLISSS